MIRFTRSYEIYSWSLHWRFTDNAKKDGPLVGQVSSTNWQGKHTGSMLLRLWITLPSSAQRASNLKTNLFEPPHQNRSAPGAEPTRRPPPRPGASACSSRVAFTRSSAKPLAKPREAEAKEPQSELVKMKWHECPTPAASGGGESFNPCPRT